ncbi:BstXI family restriction endonuclease [Rhodococcus erythropolis]|uniref:BstXI family restriction endonuclease n=1 Tax=Rhodococcus erythropolis TaxID=1833 RepID=UPI001244CE9A|nr:BstXI family restriction endonuclease [Rhodococcus erythropolis]QEX10949.1 BstXI family restriction endonuclease [Rhodococcus erythropolis]
MPSKKLVAQAKLPELIQQKLTKTGYTRGATTKEIYQNRVTRNNPVLIPWSQWELCRPTASTATRYENGFIVLVDPSFYFDDPNADQILEQNGLQIGRNTLIYFSRRADWLKYALQGIPDGRSRLSLPNGMLFVAATARTAPLGGVYFARIHATTSNGAGQVIEGFSTTKFRGAGIRVYEYASKKLIEDAKLQLECLLWLCHDAIDVLAEEMGEHAAKTRMETQIKEAGNRGLFDRERLRKLRMIDEDNFTVCPLCLNRMSAADFMKRSEQAAGRETQDMTTTEVSLFHIEELRVGKLQHKPYNLAWGHQFCNVVVKDAGIIPTLKWMKVVLDNNGDSWDKIIAAGGLVEEAIDG